MMAKPWFKDNNRIERVMNAVAAGTSNQTSSAVDMQAGGYYDECTFLLAVGTLTSSQVTGLKVQQSSDDGGSDTYDDLAGSASPLFADTDSNKMMAVTVRPTKRYLKCIVLRGTANAVIDGVFAIKSKIKDAPATQPTTVVGWETWEIPAEGTA